MNKNIFRKKITAVEPNAMKVTKPFLIDSRDYEKARVFAGSMIKEK